MLTSSGKWCFVAQIGEGCLCANVDDHRNSHKIGLIGAIFDTGLPDLSLSSNFYL